MDGERKKRLEKARKNFLERGAKLTGKPYGGNGAGTYADDFTQEERSAVMDELIKQHNEDYNDESGIGI